MIGVAQAFSDSYALARQKFLQACASAQLPFDSHPLALRGAHNEALALDAALDGPENAQRLLIVSSACHGIEGHCGSGVQVFALHDDEWRAKAREAGVAVLYLHALNPHGFSYGRRVTQENVDLNRNFVDFSQALPRNEAYAQIHDLLLPAQWPPTPSDDAALKQWIAQHGLPAFQAAVSGGQYQFADGLFFGGQAPTWSNRTLRALLRRYAAQAAHIAWIDLHTGLGPNGIGERIFAGRHDAAALARARQWWDGGGATPVTSMDDGSSTSAPLQGLIANAVAQECPQAQYTGIALEYGTEPLLEVLDALRGDHWLHQHPDAAPPLAQSIRERMRRAFYSDTDAWKGQVISQARQAMFQAVDGLSRG